MWRKGRKGLGAGRIDEGRKPPAASVSERLEATVGLYGRYVHSMPDQNTVHGVMSVYGYSVTQGPS